MRFYVEHSVLKYLVTTFFSREHKHNFDRILHYFHDIFIKSQEMENNQVTCGAYFHCTSDARG